MEENQNASLFTLNLDAQNSYTLRSAATWAKVLGVAGMILGILCIILGIIVQQALHNYGDLEGYRYRSSGFSGSSLGNMGLIAYVIMGLIFIVSSIFAINTGNKIGQGLRASDQATLNAGFAGARNFFAFWAVMIILMLLLMFISVVSAL